MSQNYKKYCVTFLFLHSLFAHIPIFDPFSILKLVVYCCCTFLFLHISILKTLFNFDNVPLFSNSSMFYMLLFLDIPLVAHTTSNFRYNSIHIYTRIYQHICLQARGSTLPKRVTFDRCGGRRSSPRTSAV
jgi:hypothetical protein